MFVQEKLLCYASQLLERNPTIRNGKKNTEKRERIFFLPPFLILILLINCFSHNFYYRRKFSI